MLLAYPTHPGALHVHGQGPGLGAQLCFVSGRGDDLGRREQVAPSVGCPHLRQGVPCTTQKGIVRPEPVTVRCVRPDDLFGHNQCARRHVGREPAGEPEGEDRARVVALEELFGGILCRCPAHAAHGEEDVRSAYNASVQAGGGTAGQALPAPQVEESADLLG